MFMMHLYAGMNYVMIYQSAKDVCYINVQLFQL